VTEKKEKKKKRRGYEKGKNRYVGGRGGIKAKRGRIRK
jgi:hypothetical protein